MQGLAHLAYGDTLLCLRKEWRWATHKMTAFFSSRSKFTAWYAKTDWALVLLPTWGASLVYPSQLLSSHSAQRVTSLWAVGNPFAWSPGPMPSTTWILMQQEPLGHCAWTEVAIQQGACLAGNFRTHSPTLPVTLYALFVFKKQKKQTEISSIMHKGK